MKATPNILNDWKARLWSRFFLLSVFATMYLNDIQRADFYAALGLDARQYDKYVIEQTNKTAGKVFPVILDVEKPEFYERLENCVVNNEKLTKIAQSNQLAPLKLLRKLPYYLSNAINLLKLYLMSPIRVDNLEGSVK